LIFKIFLIFIDFQFSGSPFGLMLS